MVRNQPICGHGKPGSPGRDVTFPFLATGLASLDLQLVESLFLLATTCYNGCFLLILTTQLLSLTPDSYTSFKTRQLQRNKILLHNSMNMKL